MPEPIAHNPEGEGSGFNNALTSELLQLAETAAATTETHEQGSWHDQPLRFVEHVFDESGPVRVPHPDAAAQVQYRLLGSLRDKGLGDYPDLPQALDAMGPKLIRESTLDQLELSSAERIGTYMLTTLMTLPAEGYIPAEGSPRRKQETPDQTVFRVAMGHLRNVGQRSGVPLPLQHECIALRKDAIRARMASRAQPTNAALAEAAEAAETQQRQAEWRAAEVMSLVQASRTFVQELPQLGAAAQTTRHLLGEVSQTYGAEEARGSDWIELPRVPSEPRPIDSADLSPEDAALTEEMARYQADRINGLHDLKDQWGDGRVQESNFSGQNVGAGSAPEQPNGSGPETPPTPRIPNRYYVAILPQTLPDGTTVEHVVVDNPVYGNALFVFRAEKGHQPDGTTINWQGVFTKYSTKTDWQRLGAVKITHQGDWKTRVLEELTRAL